MEHVPVAAEVEQVELVLEEVKEEEDEEEQEEEENVVAEGADTDAGAESPVSEPQPVVEQAPPEPTPPTPPPSPKRAPSPRPRRTPFPPPTFSRSVACLRELPLLRSPGAKLAALVRTSDTIVEEWAEAVERRRVAEAGLERSSVESDGADGDSESESGDSSLVLGSEQKLPILCYVILAAAIPHFSAELGYIRSLADPALELRDEPGYRLTEASAALDHVLSLDVGTRDSDGALIATRHLAEQVWHRLDAASVSFRRTSDGESPECGWIAAVLLQVAAKRVRGRERDRELGVVVGAAGRRLLVGRRARRGEQYEALANAAFAPLELELVRCPPSAPGGKKERPRVRVLHPFPSHVYAAVASHLLHSLQVL